MPIDIAAVGMGHTMLHELTHAILRFPTNDVGERSGYGRFNFYRIFHHKLIPYTSYCISLTKVGWRNCLRLSGYGPKLDIPSSQSNADDFAYFWSR